MTGEPVFSEVVGICLLNCKEDESCLGMVYDVQNKRCFLKQCVNPHLFTEWNGKSEDYYIFISQRANKSPNKLLARGTLSKLIMTVFYALKPAFFSDQASMHKILLNLLLVLCISYMFKLNSDICVFSI